MTDHQTLVITSIVLIVAVLSIGTVVTVRYPDVAMTDGQGQKRVSDWWWRVPFFLFMAGQLTLQLTGTAHTTAGMTAEIGLVVIYVVCGVGVFVRNRRHRKTAKQDESAGRHDG